MSSRRRFLVGAAALLAKPELALAALQLHPGVSITSTPGEWTENPDRFSYAWQRSRNQIDWSTISAGAANNYTVQQADVGSVLRVEVTAYNSVGASLPAPSAATGKVKS